MVLTSCLATRCRLCGGTSIRAGAGDPIQTAKTKISNLVVDANTDRVNAKSSKRSSGIILASTRTRANAKCTLEMIRSSCWRQHGYGKHMCAKQIAHGVHNIADT